MIKCANEGCNKNPLDSICHIFINIEGDVVCNEKCKLEYEKRKDYFLSHVIVDDEEFEKWFNNEL